MIHAYDNNYLPRAQTLMGVMFHVAVYYFNIPLEVFYDKFLFSKTSSYFSERSGMQFSSKTTSSVRRKSI